MKQQETFKNYNFDSVWEIDPEKNNGYPILKGFAAPDEAPEEPGGSTGTGNVNLNDITPRVSDKIYDSSAGVYCMTVSITNQSRRSMSGMLAVAAYDGAQMVGLSTYEIDSLSGGEMRNISVEVKTGKEVEQFKVFFLNPSTMQPLSYPLEIAETIKSDVIIGLSDQRYNENEGAYYVTVSIFNQGSRELFGKTLIVAHKDGEIVTVEKYPVNNLLPGKTQYISAQINTGDRVDDIEVYFGVSVPYI